jgi:glycosyltransferase involved in cell wall biosynthesis
MPTVSVIIPTYNRAQLLVSAIESVLAQSVQDFEIIVCDDGSTDETAALVKQLGEKSGGKIRYLALPHRGQPAATRNAGLATASGEFIALLDSDDLYLPHKLSLQLPAFEANPQVGVVYSNGHFFVDQPDKPTGFVQDGLPTPSGMVFDDLLRGNFLSTPVVLIRRSVLQQVGGYNEDPHLLLSEDHELWLRLAIHSEMLYVPGDVAAIRHHDQNISGNTLRLRSRALYMMQLLDRQYPEVMASHAVARHEGYARHHGAVALAAWNERRPGLALRHGFHVARHALQLPGAGRQSFMAWWQRRRLRSGSTPNATN